MLISIKISILLIVILSVGLVSLSFFWSLSLQSPDSHQSLLNVPRVKQNAAIPQDASSVARQTIHNESVTQLVTEGRQQTETPARLHGSPSSSTRRSSIRVPSRGRRDSLGAPNHAALPSNRSPQEGADALEARVKLPNGRYISVNELKNVPQYSLDELYRPLIDLAAYLPELIENLTRKNGAPPRAEFFPPAATGSPETAIFYNAYIPPHDVQKVLDKVISEQMDRLQASIYSNNSIYYNIVGFDLNRSLCEGKVLSQCRKLRYMQRGNEQDTMQDMYDYCKERPRDSVVYLHDKGSFNMHAGNSKVRRCATDAALSKQCYHQDYLQCDVCAMVVEALPHMHTSGNMWRTTCSYVNKLIPPMEYELRRAQMQYTIMLNKSISDSFDCYKETVLECPATESEYLKFLGIGRYAFETWIFSHPHVRSCRVMVPELFKVPNFCKHSFQKRLSAEARAVGTLSGHAKLDYFQAKGKLFEYQYLYHSQPSKDSQFWRIWRNHLETVHQTKPCHCNSKS